MAVAGPNNLNIYDILLAAKNSFENKNYQQALVNYHLVLSVAKNSPTSNDKFIFKLKQQIGICYLRLDNPEQSLLILTHLLPASGETEDYLHIQFIRAKAYVKMGKIKEAIDELNACQKPSSTKSWQTWFECKMLLVTAHLQQQEFQTANDLLLLCLAELQALEKLNAISDKNHLNYYFEINYHLSEMHRLRHEPDLAIEKLMLLYHMYQKNQDNFANNPNLTSILIPVVTQLFVMLLDKQEKEKAFDVMGNLALFANLAQLNPIFKTKALNALLRYTKEAFEANLLDKAELALKYLVPLILDANEFEDKSTVLLGMVASANCYLLPHFNKPREALELLKLAKQFSSQEKLITFEILLLELISMHQLEIINDTEQAFNDIKLTLAMDVSHEYHAILEKLFPLFGPSCKHNALQYQFTFLKNETENFHIAKLTTIMNNMLMNEASIDYHEATPHLIKWGYEVATQNANNCQIKQQQIISQSNSGLHPPKALR